MFPDLQDQAVAPEELFDLQTLRLLGGSRSRATKSNIHPAVRLLGYDGTIA